MIFDQIEKRSRPFFRVAARRCSQSINSVLRYDEDFYKEFLDAYASAREARREKEVPRISADESCGQKSV